MNRYSYLGKEMNLIIKKLFQKKILIVMLLLMDGYFFDMRKMKSKAEKIRIWRSLRELMFFINGYEYLSPWAP